MKALDVHSDLSSESACAAALLQKLDEIVRIRSLPAAESVLAMKTLAKRFPGALRELELLPPEAIATRRAELMESARGREALPTWARVQIVYHAALATALARRQGRRSHPLPLGLDSGTPSRRRRPSDEAKQSVVDALGCSHEALEKHLDPRGP